MADGNGRGALVLRLLAESLLIVVSVVAALAVDQWRERRAVEERVDVALEAFQREIEGNLQQVRAQLPYHATLSGRFAQLASGPPPRSLREAFTGIPEWRGIALPGLLDVAWDAAAASDVFPHMEYELITELARVYRQQEWLERRGAQGVSLLDPQNLAPENLPYMVQASGLFVEDIMAMERSLYCRYRTALDRIDAARSGVDRGRAAARRVAPAGERVDTLGTSAISDGAITIRC